MRNQIEKAIQALNWVEVQRLIAVALLFSVVACASGQTVGPKKAIVQQDAGTPVIQVQSKLVVVRVMVADKKAWRYGPSEAGKQCAKNAQQAFLQLTANEPYQPPACEGVFIRGLSARDFHLMVDGIEQKIENVSAESQGLRVRDNLGLHHEFSRTPAGIWSTKDYPVSSESPKRATDYGLFAANQYELSFIPRGVDPVGCHKMKVKVDRRNTIIAARSEYCSDESPSDILNGSAFGNQLEQYLNSGESGGIPLALQAAGIRGQSGAGRIQIALEFPMELLYRQWSDDWVERATIGLLGEINGPGGTLAYRFSDFACCTPYSSGAQLGTGLISMSRFNQVTAYLGLGTGGALRIVTSMEIGTLPARYETNTTLAPGEYDLKIVLSDGKKFGRANAHFKVESYNGRQPMLSPLLFCNRFRDAHVAEVESMAGNFAPQYVPMVSKGVELSPAGKTTFSSSDTLIAYFEIYKPQLASGAESGIQAHLRIVDAKSGSLVKDFPAVDAATYERPGSDVIPIAREVPISELPKGQYRLEVQASDASGHTTPWSEADFSIE